MIVTGIIDLLLKDAQGNIIAVDNKTAKQPYAQATVDEDLQLTSYAYLLASNKFVIPHRRCVLPVRRDAEIENAQVRTALHHPHRRTATQVRQTNQCDTGWY